MIIHREIIDCDFGLMRMSKKKDEIRVRLIKPGPVKVEWPRKPRGEEIPVE